jgi:hypothetical protein
MLTRSVFVSARCIIGAATVACAMCAGNVVARDHTVTVSVSVGTRGSISVGPPMRRFFIGACRMPPGWFARAARG